MSTVDTVILASIAGIIVTVMAQGVYVRWRNHRTIMKAIRGEL